MITRAQMQRQLRNKGGVMTVKTIRKKYGIGSCLLYTSPSPRDVEESRMPSSA